MPFMQEALVLYPSETAMISPLRALEAEAELPGFIGVDLKLGVGDGLEALHGLVLQLGGHGVLPHAFDPGITGPVGGVHLGGGNDLPVAGLQVKLDPGLYCFYNKLAHEKSLLCKLGVEHSTNPVEISITVRSPSVNGKGEENRWGDR